MKAGLHCGRTSQPYPHEDVGLTLPEGRCYLVISMLSLKKNVSTNLRDPDVPFTCDRLP